MKFFLNPTSSAQNAGSSLFSRLTARVGNALRAFGSAPGAETPDRESSAASSRPLPMSGPTSPSAPSGLAPTIGSAAAAPARESRARARFPDPGSAPGSPHVTQEELRREVDLLRRLIESRK